MAQTKLQAVGLRHEYYQPRTGGRLLALDNINLQVEDGEFVTIVGPSGCGKTTFINLCDGLLKPNRRKDPHRRQANQRPGHRSWHGVPGFLSHAVAHGVQERHLWSRMSESR